MSIRGGGGEGEGSSGRQRAARGSPWGRGLGRSMVCRCPKCGHTEPHAQGVPCASFSCPRCGVRLRGARCAEWGEADPYGFGPWRGEPTAEDELAFLKEEAESLKHYLEGIERRMTELEKASAARDTA